MLDFKSMAKAATRRRDAIQAQISSTRKSLAALEGEFESIGRVLAALAGESPRAGRRSGGKWRPGRPGRPPKWYLEQQKAKGKTTGKARGRKAKAEKPAKKRKKKVSPKVLAGLAKAREVLAARRAAAAKAAQ